MSKFHQKKLIEVKIPQIEILAKNEKGDNFHYPLHNYLT